MEFVVADGRDEQGVEGSSGRKDVEIGGSSAGPEMGQRETGPSPDASVTGDGQVGEDAITSEPATRDDGGTPEEAIGTVRTAVVTVPKVDTAKLRDGASTGLIGEEGPSASSADDSSGNTSGAAESAADEELTAPRLFKMELANLLDETMGDLIALEDFDRTVDDRARENEWLGKHTTVSLSLYRAELDRTGKGTFNVDENGVLLDDPVKFRLARDAGAQIQITLRVHHGLSEAKKSNFILLAQGRDRERTEGENRELKRRLILAGLLQGENYDSIAKKAGVCPTTVRNVETKAAADTNSNLRITKKDRRLTWSTPENIAEAHRLRADGKNNSQIAKTLGTTPATIGKLFKAPPAQATTKIEEEPKPSPEVALDQLPPTPSQVDTTRVPGDGIPNVVRLHLEHRGLRGVLVAKEYAKLLKPVQDEARETIEGLAKHKDQLLGSFLYHREAAAFLEVELEKQLLADGKEGAA
jgi:hypothetical protein